VDPAAQPLRQLISMLLLPILALFLLVVTFVALSHPID
jgi:hypothetical protein